jgi:hypothetical protein
MLTLTQSAIGPVSVARGTTTTTPLVEAYKADDGSLSLSAHILRHMPGGARDVSFTPNSLINAQGKTNGAGSWQASPRKERDVYVLSCLITSTPLRQRIRHRGHSVTVTASGSNFAADNMPGVLFYAPYGRINLQVPVNAPAGAA